MITKVFQNSVKKVVKNFFDTKKFLNTKKFIFLFLLNLIFFTQTFADNSFFAGNFNGKNNYVALDMYHDSAGQIKEFSACAWIRIPEDGGGWSILDFDRSGYFNLTIGGSNKNSYTVEFGTTDENKKKHDMAGLIPLNDNLWHFVCGVYDGVNKKIYVDGELDSIANNPHDGKNLGSGASRYGIIGDGSESSSFNGSRNNSYFKGTIDEVQYWNIGLSQEMIQKNQHQKIQSNPNLIGYWSFDDGEGDIVYDNSGNEHSGTFFGDNENLWTEGIKLLFNWPDWRFQRKIVIDHNNIYEDLNNFPVLLHIRDTNLAKNIQSDAKDIFFINQQNQKLSYEIEFYDNKTGELIIWVKIPFLASNIDTEIFMYYGNNKISEPQADPKNVWDENYHLVQHLKKTSESYSMRDSSNFGNHGLLEGEMGDENFVVSKIGPGAFFDGKKNFIKVDNSESLNIHDAITISAWAKQNGNSYGHIVNAGGGWSSPGYSFFWYGNKLRIELQKRIDKEEKTISDNTAPGDEEWHLMTFTWNKNDQTIKTYIDGTLQPNIKNFTGPIGELTQNLNIGRNEINGSYFKGNIDEVRISNIDRSESWIKTNFLNQDDPNLFYTLEEEIDRFSGLINLEELTDEKKQTALNFDGQNDYVALNMFYSAAGGLNQFTACSWFKISENGGGWSLLDFDRSEYFNLSVGDHNRKGDTISFGTTDETKNTHAMAGNISVNDNQWHFACGVYDGVDKKIYVDGELDSSVKNPHNGHNIGSGSKRYGIIGDGSEASSFNSNTNKVYFQGSIDEVHLWHTALNSDKIKEIMNKNLLGNEKNLVGYWDFNKGTGKSLKDKTSYKRHGTLMNMDNDSWVQGVELINLAEWRFYKKITINSDQVKNNLENFPVLIKTVDTNLIENTQKAGKDILFVNKKGKKLSFEIDQFDKSTGELIAWVKIPFLSKYENTEIYLYYGNNLLTESYANKKSVWDQNYKLVNHMNFSDEVIDSSIYENNGTPINFDSEYYNSEISKIGQGIMFDGEDDFIDAGEDDSLRMGSGFTISTWLKIKPGNRSKGEIIWNREGEYEIAVYSDNTIRYAINNESPGWYWVNTEVKIEEDTWVFLVFVYDSVSEKIRLYKNNELIHEKDGTGWIGDNNKNYNSFYIGDRIINYNEPFYGIIDEIQVLDIPKSEDWVITSFNNQNFPLSFYNLSETKDRFLQLEDGREDYSNEEQDIIQLNKKQEGVASSAQNTNKIITNEDQKIDFSNATVDNQEDRILINLENLNKKNIDTAKQIKLQVGEGSTSNYLIIKNINEDSSLEIKTDTNLYGTEDWNEKLKPIKEITEEVRFESKISKKIISVGNDEESLLLDQPARIILSGIDGDPYYSQDSVNWLPIYPCKDSTADDPGTLLDFGAECYIENLDRTIIWTYHFTDFGNFSDGEGPLPRTPRRLIFTTEDDGILAESFHLDSDDTALQFIDLEFGGDLGVFFRYDKTAQKFILNRDLDLDSSEIGDFRVESLATAPVCDSTSISRMYYNTTSHKLFYCNGTEWIDPAAAIAEGTITSTEIADETITFADIATRVGYDLLIPEYPGFTLYADGSNNVGSFAIDVDGTTGEHFYEWSSQKNSLNDYDIIVQWTVPENFQGWLEDNQVQLKYRTSSISEIDNRIDINMLDTDGNVITINNGSNLKSSPANTWMTTNVNFDETDSALIFTPGKFLTFQIKLSSKNGNVSDIGALRFNFNVK